MITIKELKKSGGSHGPIWTHISDGCYVYSDETQNRMKITETQIRYLMVDPYTRFTPAEVACVQPMHLGKVIKLLNHLEEVFHHNKTFKPHESEFPKGATLYLFDLYYDRTKEFDLSNEEKIDLALCGGLRRYNSVFAHENK